MGVKYCPKCKRVNIVTNWIPRFCMWGCGSLENEPELSENYLERQKQIKEIYYSEKELVLVGNNGQLKLF